MRHCDKIKHRTLIIPGLRSSESGGLEEELPVGKLKSVPGKPPIFRLILKSWKPELRSKQMILVGENLNIMSKTLGPALRERQAAPVTGDG